MEPLIGSSNLDYSDGCDNDFCGERMQGRAAAGVSSPSLLSVTSLSVVSSPGWAGAASIFSEQLCVTGPARAELLLVWSRS